MPPKPKYTKDQMIAAALDIVSEKGLSALTARSLGARLGGSSRPIFTLYHSMDEVIGETRLLAIKRFNDFVTEDTGEEMPMFKRIGMRTVLFSKREPKLFQLLFMRVTDNAIGTDELFRELGVDVDLCVKAIRDDHNVDEKTARGIFGHMWIYTYGISVMCATGASEVSDEQVSEMLTEVFTGLIMCMKAKR